MTEFSTIEYAYVMDCPSCGRPVIVTNAKHAIDVDGDWMCLEYYNEMRRDSEADDSDTTNLG